MKRIEKIDSQIAMLERKIAMLRQEREELLTIQDKANKYDELNKVVQDEEGNGTIENPYKSWAVDNEVTEGSWYMTESGYLWQAIKTGYPASETDNEYFDVVE